MINELVVYKDKRAVHRVWTLEMIREEILRLDKLTGLHGAGIPCSMTKRKSICGEFIQPECWMRKKEERMAFVFSRPFFESLSGTGKELSKLDTVRHEYAHFYAYMHGYDGIHGEPFRAACKIVDCYPRYEYGDSLEYLERVDAMCPYTFSIHPENPVKEFHMTYDDALWALKFHPMFGRMFLDHLTVIETDRAPGAYRSAAAPPRVLLKADRLKSKGRVAWEPGSWTADPLLTAGGETYEEAIIQLAHKVLEVLRW